MKVSKELEPLVEESNSNLKIESSNLGLWILGGILVLGLVYYWDDDNKENQNKF
tara:strand:- start:91 stop:252 length:162 start_codon:yes stop_codon:yes gene_type:complete